MRFTSDGAEREDEAGAKFGRTRLDGDTLRIPAATASELPSLLVVRRRMHDIRLGPDLGRSGLGPNRDA